MYEEVKDALSKMARTSLFDALPPDEQDQVIFTSQEFLLAMYHRRALSPTLVAFQVLYDLEAETEHYQHLKRHGVKSFSTKGVSVTFETLDNVSPTVVSILGKPNNGARVGRLM